MDPVTGRSHVQDLGSRFDAEGSTRQWGARERFMVRGGAAFGVPFGGIVGAEYGAIWAIPAAAALLAASLLVYGFQYWKEIRS